ncbi:helicase C-terminal domain-containing protein [Suillus paluster]|uniref:helicase C-terminal domain-containing protein n=1 Tax=Suillus paluster TaxID=48578 RepID=UPI001B877472|nr:helicase C-terminal domain-containing protein [Suillus paluster]KAG1743296.1 helicase C-terminal domain-containing protein [Suillus paluster]
MDNDDLVLPTPSSFPTFPYDPPYSIQTDLMRHVYTSIEKRQVTIVESPTGTGKTLSLLCSSLSWLVDEKDRAREGQLLQQSLPSAVASEPSWVAAQALDIRKRELESEDQEYEERLTKARKTEAHFRMLARARVTKKQRMAGDLTHDHLQEDAYLPDDDCEDSQDNFSPAVRALMAKIDKNNKRDPASQGDEPSCTKIYYASRTHSQLSQVLPELSKLKFKHLALGNAVPDAGNLSRASHDHCSLKKRDIEDVGDDQCETDQRQWRTVSLGSRKQLCINEDAKSRSGDIDEKCRELMEGKQNKRCQYLPPASDDTRMLDLRDQILAFPKDIEDLATAGQNMQTCPYYGSRRAIPQAELVTLPYNLLLQKTAREALGIDLTNQVVIIDEAHNLIPTLLSLSSVRLTSDLLLTSLKQVSVYYQKFRNRLSAMHALHLKRLIGFLDAFRKVVMDWMAEKSNAKSRRQDTEVVTVPDFIHRLGRKIEGINLLEIESYLKRSKIARKISRYAIDVSEGYNIITDFVDEKPRKHPSSVGTPPLHTIEALMLGLAGASEDGRLIFSIIGDAVEIKYQLLNPSALFRDVVEVARSVVLAGGTMSPISAVVSELFTYLPQDRLSTFSCGHIIPASNVQTLLLTRGPSGSDLEFKFAQQSDRQVVSELGQIILNFCNVVPGGMVVFFPSYASLNFAREVWSQSRLLDKFGVKKKVFLEPRESSGVETILREYAIAAKTHVDKKTGAVLFAVIGAKLSEGLNFSDDLARAVVVIGLPFANKNSPELQERMRYANQVESRSGVKNHAGGKDAAAEMYENMCMNAVNQSIGRAIRHRGDWASLVLIDRRFTSAAIRRKLPQWLRDDVTTCETFGQAMKHLGNFYREKRQRTIL